MMLIAFNIVQNKNQAISGGEIAHCTLKDQPIDGTRQRQVARAETTARASFRSRFHGFIH